MSKTNYFETQLLRHVFTNTTLPAIGDSAGLLASAADGSVYLSLHAADPGESGALTAEASYGGYARKDVGRTTSNWSIADSSVVNSNEILFDQCTSGSNTITHFGVHAAPDASMIYSGSVTTSVTVSQGIQPRFAAGTMKVLED